MHNISPLVDAPSIHCAEAPGAPCAIVLFGASGDLGRRKLIPSLAQLAQRGLLSRRFCLIGCGRSDMSDEVFRAKAVESIKNSAETITDDHLNAFVKSLSYVSGSYDDPEFYAQIEQKLTALSKEIDFDRKVIFYLSVPPMLYGTIADHIRMAGLSDRDGSVPWHSHLVIEKPFGRDLDSARKLNDIISRSFDESETYRIDHYLGKETVQNILMFRFANAIFEPLWNRNHIDSIQLTISESLGVEHRGGYYDQSGALRDMFQNHMLQMLTLVAMEPPTSFAADRVRDEKLKLLRSIRPITAETVASDFLRAQYGPNRKGTCAGYRQENGVDPDSTTETFAAAKLFIDNWRWKGIPFYLRTGKLLASKNTEIAVYFKQVPHSLFASEGIDDIPPNELVMHIQPTEGISLQFQAKRPGSKLCMGTLNMAFNYEEVFGVNSPEAYQRLLLDCMTGDQTLFMRFDTLETTWKLLDPVLKAWEADKAPLPQYPAECQSFPEADKLIASTGHNWRLL